MAGLYLYCFREDRGIPPLSLKGIDGVGEIFGISLRGLEAVVSEVSMEEFASEEVQRKAREDLNWIKEKAVAHARIIEETMLQESSIWPLIPMKFGIIFKDISGLRQVLEENHSRFQEALERVRGKQEWSVKVYLENRKAFEEEVKGKNDFIRQKQKEIASLPEGMAYFVEEEFQTVLREGMERELALISNSLHESLRRKADSSDRCKLLGKELTGRSAPMILNGAYLCLEEKIGDFKKEVETLSEEAKQRGLSVESSGPWPPYNFARW